MYLPYSVSFALGLALLHLPTTDNACPPSDRPEGAISIQFCSDSKVTSNNIYIDSSDASNRVTNCTCTINTNADIFIYLKTTLNQTNDCRSKITHGFDNFPKANVCIEIDLGIEISTFQIYSLTLINEEINVRNFCLHLSTGNAHQVDVTCFPDKFYSTTTTTSAEPYTTANDKDSTSASAATTPYTTGQQSSTKAISTYTEETKQGLPVSILAPVAGGGVLIVIVIIIIIAVIVCNRRKRKHQYDEPGPKADSHSYMNQAVVHDEDDDDVDDMRDNELYRSMDSDPLEDDNIGGYAEINLTDPRDKNTFIDISGGYAEVEPSTRSNISNTNSTTTQEGQTMYSVPTNSPLKQVQGGVVYSMPVKKPKTQKHENYDASVYAIPDKKENQQDLETGPVYAIVNKKTKNEPKNSKTIASKPPINKKPPIVTPKPSVAQSGSKISRENVNTDRLHYSDIEPNSSRTTPSSLEFNVSDKTGYAEVL